MTQHHNTRCRLATAWLAAGLMAIGGIAQAAPRAKNVDPLRMQYERERANCMTGQTNQPRDVCLREAGAAYAQARQGKLVSPGDRPEQWAANALKRCQAQPTMEDREMCERRVREGQVVGSVEAGGQLTTLTVRTVETPKNPG
ncbi:hypothetical protein ASC95_03215 [Pelomonas sp. Root1217]|uniref:hypothetical protein n=1 Tax=Pelomonas sp. Root1217 TaxID=1736430 RepID=UPI00070D4ECC|nr:hypothetical protein [Pelomonas sp. Root1217]KQV60476.1 hypothetical protein ASC95_03215 [Pelomonas sp. Root1217]